MTEDINKLIHQMQQFECSHIQPDTIILPGAVVQYLAEQGYDTQDKIMDLIKRITKE